MDTHPTLFPWTTTQAALDAEEGDWAVYRYRGTPEHGASHTGEVSKVIGAQAERIRAGKSSGEVRQETLSMVYHVVDGEGTSQIGDTTFTWKKGDTFCIPSWYKYQVRPSHDCPAS